MPSYIPKNIITRSLGPNAEVEVDLEGPFPLEVGDTFLLCSDGLSGQVQDDEIGKILKCLPPADAVRALVDLANLRGGPDNITVVVVRITGPQIGQAAAVPVKRHRPPPKPVPALAWTLLGLFALATAFLAAIHWVVPAIVSALATIAVGALAFFRRYGGVPGFQLDGSPLGKGPYTSCDATPDVAFVDRLAKLAEQLRDAGADEDWVVDWSRFRGHTDRALAAMQESDYCEAIRQYCHAISYMMGQLRAQRDRNKKNLDSSIDFF